MNPPIKQKSKGKVVKHVCLKSLKAVSDYVYYEKLQKLNSEINY